MLPLVARRDCPDDSSRRSRGLGARYPRTVRGHFFHARELDSAGGKKSILPCFRWSPEEIVQMIRAVDPEDWGRGTLVQCVDIFFTPENWIPPGVKRAYFH